MMVQSARIARLSLGLQVAENFHEFCRFFARMKAAYHLSELRDRPEFDDWISVVTEFTGKGFISWEVPYRWNIAKSSLSSVDSGRQIASRIF